MMENKFIVYTILTIAIAAKITVFVCIICFVVYVLRCIVVNI